MSARQADTTKEVQMPPEPSEMPAPEEGAKFVSRLRELYADWLRAGHPWVRGLED